MSNISLDLLKLRKLGYGRRSSLLKLLFSLCGQLLFLIVILSKNYMMYVLIRSVKMIILFWLLLWVLELELTISVIGIQIQLVINNSGEQHMSIIG